MNCKRLRELFDPSLAASAEVIEHLERCGHCRAYADEMQKLQALLASFPTIPVPGNFDLELSTRLAAAQARQVIWRQGTFKRSFALAASVLVALAIGFVYLRYQSSVTPLPENHKQVAGTVTGVDQAGTRAEKATEPQPETPPTARSGPMLYADANLQRQAAAAGEALLPARSRAQTAEPALNAALARRITAADTDVVLLLRDEDSQEETVVTIPPVVFGSRPLVPTISKLVSTDKRGVL